MAFIFQGFFCLNHFYEHNFSSCGRKDQNRSVFNPTHIYTPPEADLVIRKLLLAWKQKISVPVLWLSPAGAALL